MYSYNDIKNTILKVVSSIIKYFILMKLLIYFVSFSWLWWHTWHRTVWWFSYYRLATGYRARSDATSLHCKEEARFYLGFDKRSSRRMVRMAVRFTSRAFYGSGGWCYRYWRFLDDRSQIWYLSTSFLAK